MPVGVVSVPASFEALRKAIGAEKVSEVLLECPDDLEEIKKAVAEVIASGQSKLLFLRGTPGLGKTTLVQSTPVFLSDVVGVVLDAPPEFELPLSDLPQWLSRSLPQARERAGGRLVVVNLDQRETPVLDETATLAAMGNLNGVLRNHHGCLLLWPVNSLEFAEAAVQRLTQAGGQTALVARHTYQMTGLPSARYHDALQLLLAATSVRLEDAAVEQEEVENLVARHGSIGAYLQAVQQLVVARYDIGELGRTLPRLSVVVSSNDDTYGTCRLLRRGSKFLVDPQRVLQFSRANVAHDWRRRGEENARRTFAFVASLFELRLLNLSSSAVTNGVAWGPDEELASLVRQHYQAVVKANAANSMRNSSLARSLRAEDDVGVASSNPGAEVRNAYGAVQARTNEKHRRINEAIMRVLQDELGLDLGDPEYEFHPFADEERKLTVDVWIARHDRPEALEFTHRGDGNASLATISSYLLTKVQDYARDYGLI